MRAIAFGILAASTIIGDAIMISNKVPYQDYASLYFFVLFCSAIGMVFSSQR